MKRLAKIWLRRNRKGTYVYYLRWIGEDGREKYKSLGHSDKKEAGRQRREKELELISDAEQPEKMKLSELLEDYLERTQTQIEPSTAKAVTDIESDGQKRGGASAAIEPKRDDLPALVMTPTMRHAESKSS